MPTLLSSLSGDARQLPYDAFTAITLLEAIRDETGRLVDFAYLSDSAPDEPADRQRLLDCFPEARTNGQFERWVRVVETGEPARFQEQVWHEKTSVWFDTQTLRRGDGLIELVSDITALKQAEQAQQHTVQLQQLIDTLPSMLTISEAIRDEAGQITDFRVISANQAALSLFNRKPADVIGRLVSEAFPYDQTNGVYDAYVRTIDTSQPQQIEIPLDTPKGLRWFDIRLTVLTGDRLTVLVLDITQLKRAQLLNQHQADTLFQVMNATPAGITQHEAVRSHTGDIVDFSLSMINQQAASWMGGTPDAMRHSRLSDRFPNVAQTSLFQRYCQVIATGQSTRFARYVEGKWFDFSVVKSGDGCLVAAVDVTQNYEQRQELEAANAELLRSNDSLAQFAYVASHDLQEPLRKIQAFGDLLAEQYGHQLSGEGLDLLTRMQAAANRMSLLIRDLLDYSRISTHRDTFHEVSLNELLQETLDDLCLTIQETEATIRVGTLPIVTGDRRQLKQVLQNLITNAIKFRRTDDIPQITLSATVLKRSDLPDSLPVSKKASVFHEIAICDNGIGFDTKHADRIFHVFHRLHGRSRYPGTGVGLAICRKVAENHGGAIIAQSQPGQGATFRLYLPV